MLKQLDMGQISKTNGQPPIGVDPRRTNPGTDPAAFQEG